MRLNIVLSIFFLTFLALARSEEAAAADDATVETEVEATEELVCHANCETCTGPGADECSSCKAGFKEVTSGEGDDAKMSCVDINECVEQSGICPVGKYCANTEGSYSCEGCHPICKKCYGPSRQHCFDCVSGSIMRAPFTCQDIDECASGALCMGMYEVCVNTP